MYFLSLVSGSREREAKCQLFSSVGLFSSSVRRSENLSSVGNFVAFPLFFLFSFTGCLNRSLFLIGRKRKHICSYPIAGLPYMQIQMTLIEEEGDRDIQVIYVQLTVAGSLESLCNNATM